MLMPFELTKDEKKDKKGTFKPIFNIEGISYCPGNNILRLVVRTSNQTDF
jgi:hypothetical protein